MTTQELKQRIAEAIKPFWGNYIIGRDVCQLLQDCLNHIEELEREVVAHKTNFKDSVESHHRRGGYIDQLQSQLREREADCAAMREALETCHMVNAFREDRTVAEQIKDNETRRIKALSSTAGRELLERLQKAEKERDRYKTTLQERDAQCADHKLVEKLADAFVAWPLPDSVCSDKCVTESGYRHRSGTNLLTVTEAREMFKYVLSKCGVRLDSGRDLLERLQKAEDEVERLKSVKTMTLLNEAHWLLRNMPMGYFDNPHPEHKQRRQEWLEALQSKEAK